MNIKLEDYGRIAIIWIFGNIPAFAFLQIFEPIAILLYIITIIVPLLFMSLVAIITLPLTRNN